MTSKVPIYNPALGCSSNRSTSQKVNSGAANDAMLYAAAQLDAHKTVDFSVYEQLGLAPVVNASSSSLAAAASSTRRVPPPVTAARTCGPRPA